MYVKFQIAILLAVIMLVHKQEHKSMCIRYMFMIN